MSHIVLKVHNTAQTIAQVKLNKDHKQPTVINAVSRVNYELIDADKGIAPDQIITKRMGDDLLIFINKKYNMPELVIKDYYTVSESPLIGVNKSGSFYYYTPDSGNVEDYTGILSPNSSASPHSLGGDELSSPWWSGDSSGGIDTSLFDFSSFELPLFAKAFVGTVLASELLGSDNNDSTVNETNKDNKTDTDTDKPDEKKPTKTPEKTKTDTNDKKTDDNDDDSKVQTGSSEKDTFAFSDLLDGSITTIKNFDQSEDVVALSGKVFTSLTKDSVKIMDYMKYDSQTGHLSYDKDAGGSAPAVHFATLDKGLELTEQNFQVSNVII